ncbi:RICIN domain-containing protein [Streptomyces sp. NBC_00555]|uniref:RICIN domain-containing protein n=1 Tax=Streptomyces sp. NBC_00555 TaxID=2903662 RepID=UPI00225B1037|nr:RICIN domain-containing protein [Streptomyces sp. NBC_00555]MCX5016639.1 RICIN domain-containing protein [Streptomyces sp. NBC_00555]
MAKAGRPQGGLKGQTEQANELAAFLRDLTRNSTVRELAERYRISKTSWGEYRSGSKILPWHLLERTVLDRVHDSRGRAELLAKARRLHTAALEAEQVQRPAPAAAAARAQRQAEEDLAHTERLTQAILQIAAVLQNPSPPHPERVHAPGEASSPDAGPSGTGSPADPVASQHLEQAQVRLDHLRQIHDAAQQAQAAAHRQYVQAFEEQTPQENTAAARPEDTATAHLPAVRATDVQAQVARVHSDVEEAHRQVAALWRQVSREPMTTLVVPGEVLTPADNDLTSGPTDARPAPRRPRWLATGLATLATVVAAAGATAATMLYLRPAPPAQAAPPSAQAQVQPSLTGTATATATAPASATPSPSPSGSTPPPPSSGPGVSETRDPGQAASPAPTPHAPVPGTSAAPPAEKQPAPQQPVQPGPRPWANMNSGKCLEIRRDSTENGATANQWTCNNSPTQQWKTTSPTGWGTIVNANSGLCLEIRRDATGNGATANQWECNGSATQNWHWKPSPGGGWNLVNANSGKCLEITAGSTDNGSLATQQDCNSSPAQNWT